MRKVICEQFGPPELLSEIDTDIPAPQAEQLLVRVTATGLGFVDGLTLQGLYQVKPELPYCPGNEYAGVVEAVGADCEGFAKGDRVFGRSSGALADYICTPLKGSFHSPDHLDDALAASLYTNYLTAIHGLRDCGGLERGETVLVLGAAGGVGSAAIAVAKAMGAQVVAAASSVEKREFAMAAGADAVVDYTQADWREALRSLTPNGLDMVYDPVGGAVSEAALRSLAANGRFLVVGFAAGNIAKIPLNLVLLKRCSIVGVNLGAASIADPDLGVRLMQSLIEWMHADAIKLAPVSVRSAEDYIAAFKDQLAGRINGKLVLTR